jgi:hypothetical protein
MVVNAPFWKLFVFDKLDKHMCHTATCHGQDQPFLLHISELWNRLSLPGWHFGKLGQLHYVGCLQKSTTFGHHSQWLDVVNRLHSLGLRWTQRDSTSQRRKMRAGLEPLVMATSPLGALPCLAAHFEGAWINCSNQTFPSGIQRAGLCQGCDDRTMNPWATMSLKATAHVAQVVCHPQPVLNQSAPSEFVVPWLALQRPRLPRDPQAGQRNRMTCCTWPQLFQNSDAFYWDHGEAHNI